MLAAIFIFLAAELLGELFRSVLHLPVPGPVIGMIALAAWLIWCGRTTQPEPSALDRAADGILGHLGLLFVPAGVGIIGELAVIRREWLPILGGVVGSTILSLAVTGLVLHHLLRRKAAPKRAAALAIGDKACIAKS
ncbi:MAG: CidA/LrgA family protein [Methylovirgula sp.]|uniref:CidA/LrgA family protein n=1 Tax=Methylovirgula sp. TaxID=1978224 RepID=UPI00307625C0